MLVLVLGVCLINLTLVSALGLCDLDVELVNQDPDPAMPGEYVELVFQMSGLENSACGGARFKIIPSYPFSLDEHTSSIRELKGTTHIVGYSKVWNIPFDVRVDKNAVKGRNKISVEYNSQISDASSFFEDFNITVEDLRVDFLVSVKDYDSVNKEITFEILNLGENDVEALTIDIPSQSNFIHKGASRSIVGDLDSNEDTTFTFKAEAKRGDINLDISYTDGIDERRSLNKTTFFEPSYFAVEGDGYSISFYILIVLVVLIILNFIRKKFKKKKKRHR
jgi:hypothetical protein